MIYTYPGLFMKSEDGLTVTFKDFNNATTQGNDLNDCIYMAQDLLTTLILDLQEENNVIPSPSKLDCYNIQKEVDELNEFASKEICKIEDCFVNYVSVDPQEFAKLHFDKLDKKTLTIPHWLNVKGKQANVNFSKLLTEALINYFKL